LFFSREEDRKAPLIILRSFTISNFVRDNIEVTRDLASLA
jgi:hypothetical protein